MLRLSVILGAVFVWLGVLGCVMWPTESSTIHAASPSVENTAVAGTINNHEGLPFCSVTMQIQRTDWIDKYKASIDDIAKLGADTVMFVVDTRTEGVRSARIWLDTRYTPTPDQLSDVIRYAKSKKLRVILMPVVLLDNPKGEDWRGKIEPTQENGGWDEWFKSYRDMITTFAWIADGNGVDVLVVGSELISAEPYVDQWADTIAAVRKVYHGRLTYSSNWDHYHAVKFWDQLDLIAMNSYWKFGKEGSNENPSVEQIVKRWGEITPDLLQFVKDNNKPLLFSEIGWFSQKNVAYEPWDYTQNQPVDLELQKKLYQAFFQVWWGNPNLGGFSIWEWPPGSGGPEDGGYTPKGKPAEQLIGSYLSKPRWSVQ